MPRRNAKRKRKYTPGTKPKGLKRPRSFHHGALQGETYAEIDKRFREAEEAA